MQDLGAGVAVRIVERIACDLLVVAAVVDHHILTIFVDREAVMPRTVLSVLFAGLEYRLRVLAPGGDIQQIAVFVRRQQPHAVVMIGSAG
ncbi:hypothetical protein D3C73_1500990 [compost metagenome]